MHQRTVKKLAEKYLAECIEVYGESKFQLSSPHLSVERSPYSDALDPDLLGEYIHDTNEIIIYFSNIKTTTEVIRTIVHEYMHHLQSPTWMTRYYNMGYGYYDHPYEIAAFSEEDKWVDLF
tara:strand:- start:2372 stop:2734 length:363 start_codon:yes stop_codon:yes gene_type:complete